MSERGEKFVVDGVAYVMPKYEGGPLWARRIGAFGIGLNVRPSSFGVGVDVLEAGLLVMAGPVFLWVAHIKKQTAAFEASTTTPDQANEVNP